MCLNIYGWECVSSSLYVQKGLWLGICVIQSYSNCLPQALLGKFLSIPFRMEKLQNFVHLSARSIESTCKDSHLPNGSTKFRLSKAHVHGRHAFIGHVPDDDDLEVMEIRSSPSSSLISTVAGGCTGRTGCPLGRTTGRNPKSGVALAICPLSARSSPVNLSM